MNSIVSNRTMIQLRPATAEDESFVDDLLVGTMHEYVEAEWPDDPEEQQRYYELNKFQPSKTLILQCGDKRIGRLLTTLRKDCIFVEELHILPEYQRRGIGTFVIEQIIKEAGKKNLVVELKVLRTNPAQHLYVRMGFKVVSECDRRLHMRYVPG